jgi:hypothetical protein
MNQSGIDLNQEKTSPFTFFFIHFPLLDNFSKRGKEKVIQNGQLLLLTACLCPSVRLPNKTHQGPASHHAKQALILCLNKNIG